METYTKEMLEEGQGAIWDTHTLIWWCPGEKAYRTTARNGETMKDPEAELAGWFTAVGGKPVWM